MAATGSRKDYDVRIRAHDETRAAFQQAQSRISTFTRSAETLNDSLGAQTSAMRANATAAQAMGAAHRASSAQMRMLFPQIMQIGQSIPLAFQSPLTFMQNFAYQSTDIAQIYSGRGGVNAALRDSATMIGRFAAKLGPAGIAVGLLGAGLMGLRDDIRRTTGESVTLGNVLTATWQVMNDGISTRAAPAVAWLKEDFSKLTTAIIEDVRVIGDTTINGFEAAYNVVTQMWGQLPEVFGHLMLSAGQNVLDGLNNLIQMGINDLNTFIRTANSLLPENFQMGELAPFEGFQLDNPFEETVGADLERIIADAFSDSPTSDAFAEIGQRAVSLATASDAVADSLDRVGTAAQSAGAPMDLLGNSVQAANDNFEAGRGIFNNFFQDLSKQIQQGASVWDAFKTAGLNALNSVLSKVMEMASNSLFMSLFGGGSGGGGGLLSGLFGSFGGFFANGGTLGAGQWGIAGERGPEPIVGPAKVISNDNYMRAANNNAPQPTVIYQTNYITNPYGMEGVAQAIQQGNANAVAQATGASVERVANIQRRTARPLG